MKKSEFKKQIKEEIISILKEQTVVDKTTKPESLKGKDPQTVKTAIETAKKTNKPVTIAEEDGNELEVGDIVTIPMSLTIDPYNKRGEEGKILIRSSDGMVVVIEFNDGSLGLYDPDIFMDSLDEGRGRPKKSESKKEDDEDEEDVKDDWEKPEADEDGDKDKEPSKAELAKMKKDSVATISNKLQKIVKQMKDKVEEYKTAEGDKKEAIKDELKELTKEKKKLENQLS
jgi:hypothetical protein